MATMFGLYPFLLKLYADGGYQGPVFRRAMTKIMAQVNVEIVKRSDHAKGFVVLPKRWVVERTFAWLGRCRRLAKDWENLNRKALAFLRLASIRLMLRKLCNPVGSLRTDSERYAETEPRHYLARRGTCVSVYPFLTEITIDTGSLAGNVSSRA